MIKLDNNKPIPILILGDGPDTGTGLARIGHDLAYVLCSMPEFRVGYLGRNSVGRAKYPWANYSFPVSGQWGEGYIQQAWDDLRQGANGIILTVWDASRLLWFGNPIGLPEPLTSFLGPNRTFQKWGYFMQDCDGIAPNCLPYSAAETMAGYDRVLMASKWAFNIAKNSLQHSDLDWLPHGINRTIFRPDAVAGSALRSAWGMHASDMLIGCVMTNQARKHWPIVLEAVAKSTHSPRLWLHTNKLFGEGCYWNIQALIHEYELADHIFCDNRQLTDTELAMRYSACDLTVMISGGEGFCYPVAESLSCGTPVVTGSFGAQAELVGDCLRPAYMSIETVHNVRRGQYDADSVAAMIDAYLMLPPTEEGCTERVSHLDWKRILKPWEKYFRRGIQCES